MPRIGLQLSIMAAGCAAALALAPVPAAAENPFISFLRGDWLRPRPAPPAPTPVIPVPDNAAPAQPRAGGGGGGVAYCVRTCDGRYFPLSGIPSGDRGAAEERCNSFCPASATRVFVSHDRSSGIDAAYARDGQPYRSMPNAYAYRKALDPQCTCNHQGPLTLAPVDLNDDPTLKPGDLVIQDTGITVFRGGNVLPHLPADFVPAGSDSKLSASVRKELDNLHMASGRSGPR